MKDELFARKIKGPFTGPFVFLAERGMGYGILFELSTGEAGINLAGGLLL